MLRTLFFLLVVSLAGCSIFGGGSSSDEPVEKPAQLGALPAGALSPRVLWRADAGQLSKKDYYGMRLVFDAQHLYAADSAGRVSAFEPASGRATWKVKTQPRVAAGAGLAGNLVLVGTFDGEVIALDSGSGAALWRTGVSSEVLAAPLGNDETVVVRTGDGRLYGLAAADGQRRWVFDRAAPTLSLRGISQPLVADGRVYVGLDTGKLIALDLSTGRLLWEETVSAPSGRSEIDRLVDLDADPVLTDNVLYAVSFGGQLVALDAISGKLKWRQSLSSYSGLAVDGDRLYASDQEGRVFALDRSNGTVLWQQEGLKLRQLTRPVIHAGLIAVGDFEGYVHWLSAEDGSLKGRLKAGRSALIAPPLVDGDRLYIFGRSGDITAIVLPGSG